MTVMDGLLDEARRSGDRVIRHWKMRQGMLSYCGSSPTCASAGPCVPAGSSKSPSCAQGKGIKEEIQDIRKIVQATLAGGGSADTTPSAGGEGSSQLAPRVSALEKENRDMKGQLKDLTKVIESLRAEISGLKLSGGAGVKTCSPAAKKAEPKKEESETDEDDDVDLFGSDDEEDDEEKERIKQERLDAYAAKKSKKPGPIAKSSIILDIKPWDDETDMKEAEKLVRSIEMDGLVWGASKLVPVAFGIKKVQIICIIEDEKVSVDSLTEQIEAFEDFVQSVDIAAFNKI